MNRDPRKNCHAFRPLAGWCGLLLYLGAYSPIGMGMVALFGAADPDHHAILQPGASGMRLVLRHDGNCPGHHHGAVARALTIFAQPASATDPDHVLQFSSASVVAGESQLSIPTANPSEFLVVHFAEPLTVVAAQHYQFTSRSRPPPGDAGKLLCLRSTVLLI